MTISYINSLHRNVSSCPTTIPFKIAPLSAVPRKFQNKICPQKPEIDDCFSRYCSEQIVRSQLFIFTRLIVFATHAHFSHPLVSCIVTSLQQKTRRHLLQSGRECNRQSSLRLLKAGESSSKFYSSFENLVVSRNFSHSFGLL